MNVQYVAYLRKTRCDRESVFARLRQSLIVLKQFEQCYVVARWIRILWTKILDRSSHEPKTHEHSRTASRTEVNHREDEAGSVVSDPNSRSVSNDHGYYTPKSSTNNVHDPQSMMTETGYLSDERSQINPYLVDDWPGIFAVDSYEAQAHLSLSNSEYHGLQFLASLESMGYDNIISEDR